MSEIASILLFLFLAAAYVFLCSVYLIKHGSRKLKAWAINEGYRVIKSEYKFFSRGPLKWRTSSKQALFYATLQNDNNEIKKAWILIGGKVFSMWSNKVQIFWEE